jgi:adenylyltransferase/sulfurtransferase
MEQRTKDNGVLSDEERLRYARHLMLPEIGESGQKKLKAARVLIVGIGGLGSPISLYLAASGIGTLGLLDADIVDVSNLQRQIIFGTNDIGRPKTEAAAARLASINPNLHLTLYAEKLTAQNALPLIADYDIIVDGTDNFAAHYLINDACVLSNKPMVYGNVHRFEGQVGVVLPREGPCYRCLYPTPPPAALAPSCAEAGVLNTAPGLIGLIQATEVLKLILQCGETLHNRMLRIDSLKASFRDIKAIRDPDCAVCGTHPTITTLAETNAHTACPLVPEITADALKQLLKGKQPLILLDVRNPPEYATKHIDGARLIPLPMLEERLNELARADKIIVYCQSGMRSAKAAVILQSHGYTNVCHLTGGIVAYGATSTL